MIVVMNSAIRQMIELMTNRSTPENLQVRLFRNDRQPTASDKPTDFVEASFHGYLPVTTSAKTWTVTGDNPTDASHAPVVFVSTQRQPRQQVYGYYVTGAESGRVYWAERFEEAYTMHNMKDAIVVEPQFSQGVADDEEE